MGVIVRPNSESVYHKHSQETVDANSTVLEYFRDERTTPPNRSEPDSHGWRPPMSYYRYIEEGDSNTYTLAGQFETDDMVASCNGYRNLSGGYYTNVSQVPDYLRDKVIQRALNKLKNSDFDAAQVIGERAQTGKLIGGTLREMRSDVERERARHRPMSWSRFNRELPKTVIMLQYAWRPLIADAYNAVKELHSIEEKANQYFVTVKASTSERFEDEWTKHEAVAGAHFAITKRISGRFAAFVRLDYVKNNAPLAAFSSLGITNPLKLAWELTRLSFVVDWFVPIGSYLNVLDADYGWSFKGGSLTRRTLMKTKVAPHAPYAYAEQYPNEVQGSLHANGNSYQRLLVRQVFSESPLPALPRYKSTGSAEHVMNGIALLNQSINNLLSKK